MEPKPDLIRTPEAAAMLGLTRAALAIDRRRDKPRFPYIKLGPKVYRYRRSALERLIAARTVAAAEDLA